MNIRQKRLYVPDQLFIYSNDALRCEDGSSYQFCYYEMKFIKYKSDYSEEKINEWYSDMVSLKEEVLDAIGNREVEG